MGDVIKTPEALIALALPTTQKGLRHCVPDPTPALNLSEAGAAASWSTCELSQEVPPQAAEW